MPEFNQKRLIEFRNANPGIKITIIYSSDLLTDKADASFRAFADKNQLSLVNVPLKNEVSAGVYAASLEEIDKTLYAIAREELLNIQGGGNPAFASDLMRLVFLPLYRNYSDIDTQIKLPDASDDMFVEVSAPFLYPKNSRGYNNDVLLLPTPQTAKGCLEQSEVLDEIKRRVVKNCKDPRACLSSKFQELSKGCASPDPLNSSLRILHESQLFSSIPPDMPYYEMRKLILTTIFQSTVGYLTALGISEKNEAEARKMLEGFLKGKCDIRTPETYLPS